MMYKMQHKGTYTEYIGLRSLHLRKAMVCTVAILSMIELLVIVTLLVTVSTYKLEVLA